MKSYARLFAAALSMAGVLVATPAPANDFSTGQKSAIEGIVRDYLLNNPEILRDAYMELERRQAREEASARQRGVTENRAALFESKNHAVMGNPNGKITLVEFFDYNCGYCKQALPDLIRLVKEQPDLRLVLKDFPVLGQNSVEAAQVAIALRKQLKGEKYWAFHTKLLGTRGAIGKAQAMATARDVGADMTQLAKDMEGPEIGAALGEVARLADALSLSGTPTYILGDEVVVGAVGYAQLKGRLDNIRKCGKSACS